MANYYAFGDIHGESDKLNNLYNEVKESVRWNGEESHLVFLGDYIDRGPDSAGVIEFLRLVQEENDFWSSITFLKGNHEDMWFRYSTDPYIWLMNGGTETLASYEKLYGRDWQEIFYDDMEWAKANMTLYKETENFIFVHAGLYPGLKPDETGENILLWVRDSFLNSDYDWGKYVVHGHTPTLNNIVMKKNRLGIDTAACFGGYLTCALLKDPSDPDEKYDPVNSLVYYQIGK